MLTQISGLDRAFFCNSGTEAWEGALKLARAFAQGEQQERQQIERRAFSPWKFFSWTHLRRAGHHRSAEISSSVRSSVPGVTFVKFNDSTTCNEI
jgi:acetylornithine/N-succinyldiaminopimelate aminotransferase